MTFYHLHGDELPRARDAHHSPTARVVCDFRAAMSALRRRVMAATSRLRDMRMLDAGDGETSLQDDPARYPQWPLILGDKWDF
jgi:hypothetical protein